MNDTRPGGRPEIGPAFTIRFPTDLTDQIDAAAAADKTTRAAWLRQAAQDRLHVSREELAPFVLWLLDDEGVDHGEVARVIEKPWNYQDWLHVFRRGGTLDYPGEQTTSDVGVIVDEVHKVYSFPGRLALVNAHQRRERSAGEPTDL